MLKKIFELLKVRFFQILFRRYGNASSILGPLVVEIQRAHKINIFIEYQ